MKPRISDVGTKYGMWTITGKRYRIGNKYRVQCTCQCGTIKDIDIDTLSRGSSTCCGCYRAPWAQAQRDKVSEDLRKRWKNIPPEERSKILDKIKTGNWKPALLAYHKSRVGSHDSDEVRANKRVAINRWWDSKGRRNAVAERCWSLKGPDGVIYQFHNLRVFIEEHKHLFSEEELFVNASGNIRVYNRLVRLSPRVKRNTSNTTNGWSWHINHESIESLNSEPNQHPPFVP